MKKCLMVLLPLLALGLALLLRLAVSSSGTESDYPSALMWDGTIYYLSVQEVESVPEGAIVGTISSETDSFPRKNGQANCCPPGTPVGRVKEGLAVLLEDVWYLCRPEAAKSAQAPP